MRLLEHVRLDITVGVTLLLADEVHGNETGRSASDSCGLHASREGHTCGGCDAGIYMNPASLSALSFISPRPGWRQCREGTLEAETKGAGFSPCTIPTQNGIGASKRK